MPSVNLPREREKFFTDEQWVRLKRLEAEYSVRRGLGMTISDDLCADSVMLTELATLMRLLDDHLLARELTHRATELSGYYAARRDRRNR